MTDKTFSSEPSSPKKTSLLTLIPEKKCINTSIGNLYIRNPTPSDFENIKIESTDEIGKLAIRALASHIQDKFDKSPLAENDIEKLKEDDISKIIVGIATNKGWHSIIENPSISNLGEAIKEEQENIKSSHNRLFETINSSYSFLNEKSLDKLKKQISDLADIRLPFSAADHIQKITSNNTLYDSAEEIVSRSTINPVRTSDPNPNSYRPIDISAMKPPPVLEDSPLARAAQQSAENSEITAQRMDVLVEVIGGLNQTLVENVLPAWFEQVKAGQKKAEEEIAQAATSLTWTKWAVITSVAVTALAASLSTLYQTSVAREIDQGSSKTQHATELLLREQLIKQQQMLEQHRAEVEQLKQLAEQQTMDAKRLHKLLELRLPGQQSK